VKAVETVRRGHVPKWSDGKMIVDVKQVVDTLRQLHFNMLVFHFNKFGQVDIWNMTSIIYTALPLHSVFLFCLLIVNFIKFQRKVDLFDFFDKIFVLDKMCDDMAMKSMKCKAHVRRRQSAAARGGDGDDSDVTVGMLKEREDAGE